ncbi:hypothetical protein GCM10017667_42480 [Streptomyces filamentosus]|uniref:Uncharacterized protein n=1 Tax=Streptomyces filamentosus TaxID=67294 RepID=A0A919BR98_STRFL|nr:hypothetical protein GCM10017667_42480 [Streptomyces filamentosus]
MLPYPWAGRWATSDRCAAGLSLKSCTATAGEPAGNTGELTREGLPEARMRTAGSGRRARLVSTPGRGRSHYECEGEASHGDFVGGDSVVVPGRPADVAADLPPNSAVGAPQPR